MTQREEPDRFSELLAMYLEGELPRELEGELLEYLKASDKQRLFLELTAQDREISGVLSTPLSDARAAELVLAEIQRNGVNSGSGRARAIMQEVRKEATRQTRVATRRSGKSRFLPVTAAASILIAFALWHWLPGKSSDSALATLIVDNGTATVIRGTSTSTHSSQTALFSGDRIEAAGKNTAVVRYSDGSQIELRAGASLTLAPQAPSRFRSILNVGEVHAQVRKQPKDAPFIIVTRDQPATVVGTEFTLAVDDAKTTLSVKTGCVRLGAGLNAIDVNGGEVAIAKKCSDPASQRLVAIGLGKVVDVAAFGAIADDGKDDTTALQGAIDASKPGDTIMLGTGRYVLSRRIKMAEGRTLRGHGQARTMLAYTSASDDCVIVLSDINNVALTDFTIDASNSSTAKSGVWAMNGRGHRLQRLTIQNLPERMEATGVYWQGSSVEKYTKAVTDSLISECAFKNIGAKSEWGAGIRLAWGSSRNEIVQNTFDNTGRGAIFTNDRSTDVIIRGNTATRSGMAGFKTGIEIWGASGRTIIEDNILDQGIQVSECDDVAIRNNTIVQPDKHQEQRGFAGVFLIGKNIVVTGNRIAQNRSIGIGVSGPDYENRYLYFAHNRVEHMTQWGVQIQGDSGKAEFLYFFDNAIIGTLRDAQPMYSGNDGIAFRFNQFVYHLTMDSNKLTGNARAAFQFSANVDQLDFIGNTISDNVSVVQDEFEGTELHWSGNLVTEHRISNSPVDMPTPNKAPHAEFSVPEKTFAGQPATFASSAADPDGRISQQLWDLGDGVPETGANVRHTYEKPGTYRIALIVWDDKGRAGKIEKNLTVLPNPDNSLIEPRTGASKD